MKYLFILTTFIAVTVTASAQDNNYLELLKRYKKPLVPGKIFPKFDALRKRDDLHSFHSLQTTTFPGKLITVMSNGTKLYSLPLDHMPCMVPDMNQYNMPNAGKNVRIYTFPEQGAIPNVKPKM